LGVSIITIKISSNLLQIENKFKVHFKNIIKLSLLKIKKKIDSN